MATTTLTKHRLDGALGEILVDVRSGGRTSSRPAVVVLHGFKGFKDWGMFPPLAERLGRGGFTAVTLNLSGSGVDDTGSSRFRTGSPTTPSRPSSPLWDAWWTPWHRAGSG